MLANLPSIQLATIEAALRKAGLEADVLELFLDYAALLTVPFYQKLASRSGFIEEWVFARHYYGPETGEDLTGFLRSGPHFGVDEATLHELSHKAGVFLDQTVARIDWNQYDVVGISLTISQLGSSMALARRLKLAYPHLRIVFGGTACAGPTGDTLLRICPYVDVVVRVEGEDVFPELVERLRSGRPIDDLHGISYREGGAVRGTPTGALYQSRAGRPHLRYDGYFQRLANLGLTNEVEVWLPFESSRGCWWGEKSHCTFCGLHEIMRAREWDADVVFDELKDWADRYGVTRFFSVDLILPRKYYETFLAHLEKEDLGWTLFYEIKANVKRAAVERLAGAGVRWIQPGIESLDREVLKLMRKGVRPIDNIQLLKWCQELGIAVNWNVIIGTPGENPSAYPVMAERMRQLFHLPPPICFLEFEMHRFSPYHNDPAQFGIGNVRPHATYRHIFPVPEEDLQNLVYRFEYDIEGRAEPPSVYAKPVMDAIHAWQDAYRRGASLNLRTRADGGTEIEDRRYGPGRTYSLDADETVLYGFLDRSVQEGTLEHSFGQTHPATLARLEARGGLGSLLDRWEADGLVMREGDQIVSLAVNDRPHPAAQATRDARQGAPLQWWPEDGTHGDAPTEGHGRTGGVLRVLTKGSASLTLVLEQSGGNAPAFARALGHGLTYRGSTIPPELTSLMAALRTKFERLGSASTSTPEAVARLERLVADIDPMALLRSPSTASPDVTPAARQHQPPPRPQ